MGAYRYQALDEQGKTVKGIIDGDSERHVRSQLRQQQLKPLQVTASNRHSEIATVKSLRFWQRLRGADLALITRQMASLVNSGLPIDEVLKAVAMQSRKPFVSALLLQVRTKVMEGLSLAQAMGQSPSSFDGMYRALVKAGEASGYLGPVLERLALHTEASQHNQQKLMTAMIYPLILLLVSATVVTLLMTFVVPKLVAIFAHSERELPLLTQVLISVSDYLRDYGLLTLVLLTLALVLLRRWLQHPLRQYHWHRLLLRLPLLGHVILQADCSRFAATLSLLTSSGVPLVDALRIATQVMTNRSLRERSQLLVVKVSEGSSLARAMDQVDFFPPLLVQMVASGEINGALDQQLQHAANQQQRELDLLLAGLTAIMEPLTVIVMGVLVTLIVLAILLPIFDLNSLI